MKNFFFWFKQISKCYTCFYIHFSRAFQTYSFAIFSCSYKNVMGFLKFFFSKTGLFPLYTQPYALKRKENLQKFLKFLFNKSQNFPVLEQKKLQGGVRQTPP